MIKNNSRNLCIRLAILFLFSVYIRTIHTTTTHESSGTRYVFHHPITIDKAVFAAYKNREDLKAFEYTILASKYEQKAALGGALPQLSVIANANRFGGPELLTTAGLEPESAVADPDFSNFPRSVTLEFSQLIFSLDGPIDQYKIAKMETKVLKSRREQLLNRIILSTEQTFYDLQRELLRKKLVAALENSSELTFDQDTGRNEVGFFNKSQWFQAKSEYYDNLDDVSNYPHDIQISLGRLEREADVDIDPAKISLLIPDVTKIKLKPLEYYYQKALAYRPELTEKDHRIKQAKYSEGFYKKQYIPELRVFANATKGKLPCDNRLSNLDLRPTGSELSLRDLLPINRSPLVWQAGVVATWKFDGLGSAHRGVAYEKHVLEFELQKKDLELEIVKDVKVIYYQLTNRLGELKATEIAYEQSLVELDRRKEQRIVGQAADYEVAQAELFSRNKEFALINLKITINKLYANLLFLCGYPPEISNNSLKVKYEQ